jgi:hypothetical protein
MTSDDQPQPEKKPFKREFRDNNRSKPAPKGKPQNSGKQDFDSLMSSFLKDVTTFLYFNYGGLRDHRVFLQYYV